MGICSFGAVQTTVSPACCNQGNSYISNIAANIKLTSIDILAQLDEYLQFAELLAKYAENSPANCQSGSQPAPLFFIADIQDCA